MSMTKIATVTATGSSASMSFTSIAGTFTDLLLVVSPRSTFNSGGGQNYEDYMTVSFNGSTSNFTERELVGASNGTVSSTSRTFAYLGDIPASTNTTNTFGSAQIYIPNYAGSTNKSYSVENVAENNGTLSSDGGPKLTLSAGLWSNTAAITSVTVTAASGNFAQYSTATLYGITKGSLAGVTVS